MAARSLEQLRSAFADDKVAAAFARGFIEVYAATSVGSLPKTEIDQLVFSLLLQLKVIDADGPSYRIARALNVTPAKARALLFQHQLRHVTEEETDHEVMMALTTARYWKDGDKLSFGVSSPLVKAAISAKMEERGVFADVSLSGNILRLDPARFGEVLSSLITPEQAGRVKNLLKKKKFIDGKGFKDAVAVKGSELATSFVKKGGDALFDKLMEGLAGAFSGDGAVAEVLDDILNI